MLALVLHVCKHFSGLFLFLVKKSPLGGGMELNFIRRQQFID